MAGLQIMQGMLLKVKQGSSGALALIGDIVDMNGPGETRTTIQIGAADSANSLNVQKAGRTTVGVWNFTVNFDPDPIATNLIIDDVFSQMLLSSAIVNDSTHATGFYSWQILFDRGVVGADTIDFDGFVSAFDVQGADDGVVTATFSIALQTVMTWGTVSA